ncbi:MAG: aspartate aminotransferase family protein [Chloroflexi bacterium]|nr:aspartate aminotransferase family protein [Chloroflexota bacterium]MYK61807.1 aspartate aminotransferase family protein [Chloroflexota bacterium]
MAKQEISDSLRAERARYVGLNGGSSAKHEEAKRWLPGGDSRNSIFWGPFPIYVSRAEGSKIVDVDGNERVDFINNMTTLILGHRHPAVIDALREQLERGVSYPAPTPLVVEWGELMCERVPSLDKVRFVNSGTEATLNAIRAARAFSGKTMLAKCEGAYHGNHDAVQISVTPVVGMAGDAESPDSVLMTRGMTPRSADEIVIMPYNDLENAERVIREHADELAAVIVEPINGQCGMVPAEPEFLEGIRRITSELSILLIFDEVIAFRASRGGAQEYYGVTPDLTCFGKVIGGGLPVGAFGGREDIMSLLDPSGAGGPQVAHAGTFNGNPMTAAAGVATLRELSVDVYEDLEEKGEYLREKLRDVISEIEAPMGVTGVASLFAIQATSESVRDYRSYATNDGELLEMVFMGMMNEGYLLSSKCAGNVSAAHTYEELDGFVEAFERVLKRAWGS